MTALLYAFTRDKQFVIGADSRRINPTDGSVLTEYAQKIFCVQTQRGLFAYAWACTSYGETDSGSFSFIQETAKVISTLNTDSSLEKYIFELHQGLDLRFHQKGYAYLGTALPPKGNHEVNFLAVGYWNTKPFVTLSEFDSDEGYIAIRDGVVLPGFNEVSGCGLVTARMAEPLRAKPDDVETAASTITETLDTALEALKTR